MKIKEIAKKFNIPISKVYNIKTKIENYEYPGIPVNIVWGQPPDYSIKIFEKYLFTDNRKLKKDILNKRKKDHKIKLRSRKGQFEIYEELRQSGFTDMFNLDRVKFLTGLKKNDIIYIMKNHKSLKQKYFINEKS